MERPPLNRQTLLECNGKEMKLTEPGLFLRDKAEDLVHQINEMIKEIKEIDDAIRGSFLSDQSFLVFLYCKRK
jgi:DNA-binding transcriptional LysR family regulator